VGEEKGVSIMEEVATQAIKHSDPNQHVEGGLEVVVVAQVRL
jgi:hypothetical protein